jgi:hypothetical protein
MDVRKTRNPLKRMKGVGLRNENSSSEHHY